MRPTLLDTMSHTNVTTLTTLTTTSTAPSSTEPTALTTPIYVAPTLPERALTRQEGREFAQLVAGLLPCRSNDPELWFAEQADQVEQAKAMCQQCPLMAACLSGAIDRAEPWGVWGGEVFVDGAVVARKRGRGRPRKDAAA
ncbi:WhiB family transcriptional regulator, redox-sensing transcriptional regulator [Sanguibacter gelidistatuariae]|uniref:Transcriptional regulator WhiB n=1 Tax=Sanguibacter gelidistatuariae TaxID=1814289 RepID=A0A1G6L2F2_9MICO|nr:WhiB family transcriptional regulator [Sanguibacter gelidistatuariae]SDC37559.1 WhiB family transcriptional regulator, redox-sensing transcriptional regulator [Sanguibacter gelidistatuariae]